jgi:hypothetical protein
MSIYTSPYFGTSVFSTYFSSFISNGYSFVDSMTSKVAQVTQAYSSMTSGPPTSDKSLGVRMPSAYFKYVNNLRLNNPGKFQTLLDTALSFQNLSNDSERVALIQQLFTQL